MKGLKLPNPITFALSDPRLERWRAVVPYPLWVGGIVVVGYYLFVPVLLFARTQPPGPRELTLPNVLVWFPLLFSMPLVLLLGVSDVVGRLSGYRPFARVWEGLSAGDAEDLSARLRGAAERNGFSVTWDGKGKGFVAVHGMALEYAQLVHKGSYFPVRVSFLVRPVGPRWKEVRGDPGAGVFDARLKVENRTSVFWDTGERVRCEDLGNLICAEAGIQSPGFVVGQIDRDR